MFIVDTQHGCTKLEIEPALGGVWIEVLYIPPKNNSSKNNTSTLAKLSIEQAERVVIAIQESIKELR